jgi:hypothetical protein
MDTDTTLLVSADDSSVPIADREDSIRTRSTKDTVGTNEGNLDNVREDNDLSTRDSQQLGQTTIESRKGLGQVTTVCIFVNYISAGYILLPSGKARL